MSLLADRVAIVTGAAQGIGRAIAERFANEGAAVVIGDIDADQATQTAEEIAGTGARAIGMKCDVRSAEDVDALIARCRSEWKTIDVFVNNAGVTRDATMRKLTLEDFELVIDVHLRGTWLGTRAAAAVMRDQGSGSIINMSSISGKVGNLGQTNYSAAKAGIVGLTKAAAKEVAHAGVRVNAIQPGLIRTAMTAAMRQDVFEKKAAEIPMGRAGEPDEVAKVALFLASDLSSYMTGTVLEVSGGRHM